MKRILNWIKIKVKFVVFTIIIIVMLFSSSCIQGQKGDKGDIGSQGIQGIPSQNLIVAMGYIWDHYPFDSPGTPTIYNSYNVKNVIYKDNSPRYEITFNNIIWQPNTFNINYVTQVTPMDNPRGGFYSTTMFVEDKLTIWLFGLNGVPTIGSFQFIVFRYPS